MTVLVGIVDKKTNQAYLASDSMLSVGFHTPPTQAVKIFDFDFMAIAVCGTWRGANIIEAHLQPPPPAPGENVYHYCINRLVPTLMSVMKEHGSMGGMLEEKNLMNNSLLVAIDGRLFQIGMDFCVLEYEDFTCDGSGMEYAYGALHALGETVPIEERLKRAIQAAAAFDKMCGHSIVCVAKGKLNWFGVTSQPVGIPPTTPVPAPTNAKPARRRPAKQPPAKPAPSKKPAKKP